MSALSPKEWKSLSVHQTDVCYGDATQTADVTNCLQHENFLPVNPNISKAPQYTQHNSSSQTDFNSTFKFDLLRFILPTFLSALVKIAG